MRDREKSARGEVNCESAERCEILDAPSPFLMLCVNCYIPFKQLVRAGAQIRRRVPVTAVYTARSDRSETVRSCISGARCAAVDTASLAHRDLVGVFGRDAGRDRGGNGDAAPPRQPLLKTRRREEIFAVSFPNICTPPLADDYNGVTLLPRFPRR